MERLLKASWIGRVRACDVAGLSGELVELTAGRKKAMKGQPKPADKLKFYAECKGYAMLHGKKPTYPDAMHMARFGHWPARKHDVVPRDPSPETLTYIRSRNIAYAKGRQKYG